MTGTQILSLASSYVDDTIPNSDAILWINAWLSRLGMDARVYNSTTIDSVDINTWYDLPSDFLAVSEIEDSSGNEYVYSYQIRNNKIKFSYSDTVTIWYYKISDQLTVLSNTPDAHPLLHSAAALYLSSRFKSMDDDENPDAYRLMQEHEVEKNNALAQIDNPYRNSYPTIRMVL